MGGTGKLVAELHRLLERAGVSVQLGVDIDHIVQQGAQVTGAVAVDGRRYDADRGICNGDPPTVYRQMMPQESRCQKP